MKGWGGVGHEGGGVGHVGVGWGVGSKLKLMIAYFKCG